MKQARTLAVRGAALPTFRDQSIFTPARMSGIETLGELFEYTLELKTAIRWRSLPASQQTSISTR